MILSKLFCVSCVKQIRQQVTIVEASAVTKVGLDPIYDWLQRP